MRILFIASGNSKDGLSTIVKAQGNSLIMPGVQLDYFTISGRGIWGYLKSSWKLRKYLKSNMKYDVIHAHYSLSAFAATLAGAKPLVVSLMGSDVYTPFIVRLLIKFFNQYFWKACIVKSNLMLKKIAIRNAWVIPNGVNLGLFKPLAQVFAIEKLSWDKSKTHILFAANPLRKEKNFNFLLSAIDKLDKKNNYITHSLVDIPYEQVPVIMNAAHVIVLTSLREGSPNVIKEAMACNRPIVATDVGDIKWILGETKGCFITSSDSSDLANKLHQAVGFSEKYGQTNGMSRIIKLQLSSQSIANQLFSIYAKYARSE